MHAPAVTRGMPLDASPWDGWCHRVIPSSATRPDVGKKSSSDGEGVALVRHGKVTQATARPAFDSEPLAVFCEPMDSLEVLPMVARRVNNTRSRLQLH